MMYITGISRDRKKYSFVFRNYRTNIIKYVLFEKVRTCTHISPVSELNFAVTLVPFPLPGRSGLACNMAAAAELLE